MTKIINKALRKLGYEIKPYPDRDVSRRLKLLKLHNIDLILDVGAGTGEYGTIMRRIGFDGRIVSFEPMQRSYNKLKVNAKNDPLWDVNNYALGNENKESTLNISGNYDSSSLLMIKDTHTNAAEDSTFVGSETILQKTLDSVFEDIHNDESGIYVKIDTQGYERFVLDGAKNTLDKVTGIQIELSISPLYDNSDDYMTITSLLEQHNFRLFSIEPGFHNKDTGRLLQFDGIFYKEDTENQS